ncbi:hypothetical protein BJY52DRAFT_1216115, partial [Lactarius psammicola]
GSSENPLYVIDTDDNITKVRRSDPKGFVNVSRVRWPTDFQKSSFRKNKDLAGVEVVFGKGHWKPADEFLGYSYGSLSSYRKFYIPHHRHSLRWKRFGSHYAVRDRRIHVHSSSHHLSVVHDRNRQGPRCRLRTGHATSTPTNKNSRSSFSTGLQQAPAYAQRPSP